MKRLAILLPILMLVTASVQAGITSNFADLRAELVLRRGVLSNSTDKVEQKQDKACLKGITLIDKGTDLADDIKASYKLGALLVKVFPNEFQPLLTGGLVFSNNVYNLILDGYLNIGNQLDDAIDETQLNINALPESKERNQAQEALNVAVIALDFAEEAFFDGDYKTTTKLFGICLKAIIKAQKIIASAATL